MLEAVLGVAGSYREADFPIRSFDWDRRPNTVRVYIDLPDKPLRQIDPLRKGQIVRIGPLAHVVLEVGEGWVRINFPATMRHEEGARPDSVLYRPAQMEFRPASSED